MVHVDLQHHGDREVGGGLVDLAVNVFRGRRPQWLDAALWESLSDIGRYPDPTRARGLIAGRHGRPHLDVLPTAGGAEAFTLVARARPWVHPVVVHPQFTEPEAALVAAGYDVERVLLREETGFKLDPALVPESADLVMIGNPTNPTGVLHPADTVLSLLRPGRILVVDEAFMDAVARRDESLVSVRRRGLAVIRSLTKTWSIPGVRAGYVAGDPAFVAQLALQQPPWSVSATALAAMVACMSPEAAEESDRRAQVIAEWRAALVRGLADVGFPVMGTPATPFVLVHGTPGMREALREQGFAVRRGDTFPGLDEAWVRIAVREPEMTGMLLAAMAKVRSWAAP